MIDLDKTGVVYVVKSKKGGNEIIVHLDSLDKVADYVEQDPNVVGVWNVTTVKLPPNVYARRKAKTSNDDK